MTATVQPHVKRWRKVKVGGRAPRRCDAWMRQVRARRQSTQSLPAIRQRNVTVRDVEQSIVWMGLRAEVPVAAKLGIHDGDNSTMPPRASSNGVRDKNMRNAIELRDSEINGKAVRIIAEKACCIARTPQRPTQITRQKSELRHRIAARAGKRNGVGHGDVVVHDKPVGCERTGSTPASVFTDRHVGGIASATGAMASDKSSDASPPRTPAETSPATMMSRFNRSAAACARARTLALRVAFAI